MSFKRVFDRAGGWVPEADRVVIAAGRQKAAVGRKGRVIDRPAAQSLKKISTHFVCVTGTKTFALKTLTYVL
jgi:hypothetical protein